MPVVSKEGLISEFFSLSFPSPENVPKHYLEHYLPIDYIDVSRIDRVWPCIVKPKQISLC